MNTYEQIRIMKAPGRHRVSYLVIIIVKPNTMLHMI